MSGITQCRLGGDTSEGHHSKSSVLKFLKLPVINLLLGFSFQDLERIEHEVSSLTIVFSLRHLDEHSAGAELDESDGKKQEGHGSLIYKNIMGLVGGRDVLDGVHSTWETKRNRSESAVGGDPSGPREHGDASVLELCLSHPVEGVDTVGLLPLRWLDETGPVLGNRGKVEGIESEVAYHGSVEFRGPGEEGDGFGAFVLVDHGVPETIGHGI
mmetsp:Transcript_22066/g.50409  ORF Transcript_22066/g.50409 Transcript_22066/m.50409 type:complete len:213 (+) Transcript_22066:350-988(+)